MIYGKQAADVASENRSVIMSPHVPESVRLPMAAATVMRSLWGGKAKSASSAVRPMTKPDSSGVQKKKPRVVEDKKKSPFDPYALGNPWLNW